MSSLTRLLKQKCVLWTHITYGINGMPIYSSPVEIKCRWEDSYVEYLDKQNQVCLSAAVVYLDRDVKVGDVLMLGSISENLESDPLMNEGAAEIKQFNKIPDLKNRKCLRVAYL